MFNWLRELKEIWHEKAECQSCEILKVELSNERLEKQRLLERILTPQPQEPERQTAPEPQAISPRHVPWRVRQAALEQKSREEAAVLAEFKKRDTEIRQQNSVPNPITPATTTEELEQTLGIVQEK